MTAEYEIVKRLRDYRHVGFTKVRPSPLMHEAADAIEALAAALDEIVNPIVYMQRRADESGKRVDGLTAISLCEDTDYLQSIARAAIAKLKGETL